MATRRKYSPKTEPRSDAHAYAEFLAAVISGDVKASRLVESRDARGRVVLDYDEPDLQDKPGQQRRP